MKIETVFQCFNSRIIQYIGYFNQNSCNSEITALPIIIGKVISLFLDHNDIQKLMIITQSKEHLLKNEVQKMEMLAANIRYFSQKPLLMEETLFGTSLELFTKMLNCLNILAILREKIMEFPDEK